MSNIGYIILIIGEGTRASESQNPATPLSQGNEEVGSTLDEYYDCITILFQMTSPQRPALVSTGGTDDTSLSEFMYRSIMYHTYTHMTVNISCGDPRISEVTGSVAYIFLSWLL